ncbi:sugar phosphate isomerase/epimerase family protein [Microbacterium xanthum]|uniref:sugar phosphate isomerase/epimerase family protein n=1 Tax=Microbacterium xanthum TaxID=3079794 RepID=UPI002AD511DE|nr:MULTISPECIES: sugar phosphate isomerase/epimerase family protein [unclassified Microbacterium]MDZ8172940.1 sugar phosphate isomerase/epimerase family protein [Microbacterium sp. KSW-48]MDZ8200929.1 sugar phosphate isomerase/epimerase family protein [Microbacterium sp. SSW1-59]
MHLSMHNWMRQEPIETTIARLAKYGYKSIEISGEPEKYDAKHVRGLLDHYGLDCWGAVTLMVDKRNMQSADEAMRASSVQYVKDCIQMVSDLGGQILTYVPGTVGKVVPDSTPENEWQWLVEGTKEIYDFAEKKGVRVGVEPLNRFESYLITRAEQALALCDAVGPNLGVVLDAFHVNIEESNIYDAFRLVGDKLVDVHVAENNRMPAGHGDYDWTEFVGVLREIGYDGALTAEFVAPVDRTPANKYPNALETNLDNLEIDEEQLKFIIDHGSSILTEEYYDWLVKENSDTLLPLTK